jgi:hypothetical protein
LHGGHGSAAAHILPKLLGTDDVSGFRVNRESEEIDPFQVTHNGVRRHRKRFDFFPPSTWKGKEIILALEARWR